MFRRVFGLLFPMLLFASFAAAKNVPDPKEIVDRVIAAAGGEAFSALGVLELDVIEEEIRNDGSQTKESYKLIVDSSNLSNLRLEVGDDIVVVRTTGGGWSTNEGVLDDRPQAPRMAQTTLNQAAFPLLLPFSLRMDGVWLKEAREAVVDGREVWVIGMPFAKGFFTNPVLETTWVLLVAKDDYSIVRMEFLPAPAYRDVSPVGVRYRILRHTELDGAKIADQILAVGINSEYLESGATRVTKVKATLRGPWDPTVFLSPAQLEALEEEE